MPAKKKNFHIIIISWHGCHKNAKFIAESLQSFAENVSIIYSDESKITEFNETINSHKLANSGYWSSKYEYAIRNFNSEILIFIHADCFADDWIMVVSTCIHDLVRNPEIGVWAPKIAGTPWTITRSKIVRHSIRYLTIVAQTDALVFAVTRPILDRMKQLDYAKNIYGWGIDWAQIAIANSLGLIGVVNSSIKVSHVIGRGYNSKIAKRDMLHFLEQLDCVENAYFNDLYSITKMNKNSLKYRAELFLKNIKLFR